MYDTLLKLEDSWDIDVLKKACENTNSRYDVLNVNDDNFIRVGDLFGYINELNYQIGLLKEEIEEKEEDLHRLTRGEDEYYDD